MAWNVFGSREPGSRNEATSTVRGLTFIGLSHDGVHLIFADARGTQFAVPVDQRLSSTLRIDRPNAQLEITVEPMRPKDVQARIRAGATAAEVAEESGWSVEHVERFAGPPMAERAYIAERARGTEIRRPSGTLTLDDLVDLRLIERGISKELVRWDAWRREDGLWTVHLSFPVGSADAVATWVYDSANRIVIADDETARDFLGESSRLRVVAVEDAPEDGVAQAGPVAVPALELENDAVEPAPAVTDEIGSIAETIVPIEPAQVLIEVETPAMPGESVQPKPTRKSKDTVVIESAEQQPAVEPEAQPELPPRAPRTRPTKGRRASVPSWDEILFGSATQDENS